MSTKLHHGYRIATDKHLDEIPTELKRLLLPVYETEYIRAAVGLAVEWIDGVAYERDTGRQPGPDAKDGYLPAADIFITRRCADRHQHGQRDTSYDFNMDVTFIPDPIAGGWLALLFTERSAYRELWEGLDWVHPYPYWDNTDRPDGITEDEWDERRSVWDRAVGWEAPATVGFSWSLLATDGGIWASHAAKADPDRVTSLIPSDEKRARDLATRAAGAVLGDGSQYRSTSALVKALTRERDRLLADPVWQSHTASLIRPLGADDLMSKGRS